ncbi:MAG: amidohydrolase family protein [Desulfobacterales bacterium]|nr:amidohydrolase family protein [Desulfobacterales bacterium]
MMEQKVSSMVIDGHVHLFDQRIIDNVSKRAEMVGELGLEVDRARKRIGRQPLEAAGRRAGVDACLVLPTASLEKIHDANSAALSLAVEGGFFIRAAGTLHPALGNLNSELQRLHQGGIRAIKLSTFSQRFSLEAADTAVMLETIQAFNRERKSGFFLVLDTYFKADIHFGAPQAHVTTPEGLGRRVREFPGIVFVAAHMGGLAAPPEIILNGLKPATNFYLDTANAAHTLDAETFTRLLATHGPERIVFGTDWPWFDPGEEMACLDALMVRAGFSPEEKRRVFGTNMARLLAL